jgi:hypothetical protein
MKGDTMSGHGEPIVPMSYQEHVTETARLNPCVCGERNEGVLDCTCARAAAVFSLVFERAALSPTFSLYFKASNAGAVATLLVLKYPKLAGWATQLWEATEKVNYTSWQSYLNELAEIERQANIRRDFP